MAEQLTLLVVGFVLTSVVGGLLGWYFQTRMWHQRHLTELREERHRQAIRTYEELSTLLDRRLYRMKRLWWSIRRRNEVGGEATDLHSVRDDYRAVLFEWNDNLNRLLALVQTYFGTGIRQMLEDEVFERFVAIGRALDHGLLRAAPVPDPTEPIPKLGHRLNELSKRVYELNVTMLALLDEDRLGRDAPATVEAREDPRGGRLEFGMVGQAVREVQQSLVLAGHPVGVDGAFGSDTYRALLAFQRQHGLEADGAVGPETRSRLSGPAVAPSPPLEAG